MTAVLIPADEAVRLLFDRSLKPVVSVSVALSGATVCIGVGCAYAVPAFLSADVGDIDAACGEKFGAPLDTPMGSSVYRRRMIGVLAFRLVQQMLGEGP